MGMHCSIDNRIAAQVAGSLILPYSHNTGLGTGLGI